ncbi:MAG: hypothetical protein KC621_07230 [Myxococcales bacterium]|nr:hypothetical protein [Myxococcales bacterium]
MFLLSFGLAAHAGLPPASASWSLLAESPVKIECTTFEERPYCRATGIIGAPSDKAATTFAELDKHVDQMEAITMVKRLEPDVLHIVMDYPWPINDRDYVARFTRSEQDGAQVFAWTPIEHAGAPVDPKIVRLPWLDGEWRFAPDGENTRVTYLWEADPGGGIPDANMVRKKAGLFALTDIATACGTTILSP